MKRMISAKVQVFLLAAVAVTVAFGVAVVQGQGQAQTQKPAPATQKPTPESPNAGWNPPRPEERCPSKWGAGDVRGAANHMGPKTIIRATQLIKQGQYADLGQTLRPGMPLIGDRRWDMMITHSGRPFGPGRTGGLTENVWTAIGQVGTQLDAWPHQMIDGMYYNCHKPEELNRTNGVDRIGVEVFGTLMTRGVLVNVAGLKGVEVLPDTYAITAQDIQDALARQKLTIQPGDAVLVHTGWGKYWREDPVRYLDRSPGLRLDAEEWIVKQDPMIVASDNCCIEVRPVGVGPLIHQYFIVVHGIVVIENVRTEELVRNNVNEFAFVVQPLKIWGATGSTVMPSAIW